MRGPTCEAELQLLSSLSVFGGAEQWASAGTGFHVVCWADGGVEPTEKRKWAPSATPRLGRRLSRFLSLDILPSFLPPYPLLTNSAMSSELGANPPPAVAQAIEQARVTQMRLQAALDRTTPFVGRRWATTGGLLTLFVLRIVIAQGWYIGVFQRDGR